jgi:hypothetical protein
MHIQAWTLKRHLVTHTKSSDNKCPTCDRAFGEKWMLKRWVVAWSVVQCGSVM